MYFKNYDFVAMEGKTNNIRQLTKYYYEILENIFVVLLKNLAISGSREMYDNPIYINVFSYLCKIPPVPIYINFGTKKYLRNI